MARHSKRLFVEGVPKLDIRELVRKHDKQVFRRSELAFDTPYGRCLVDLTRMPTRFGSERVYFLCRCGKRVDILYLARGRLACRKCHNLHYWCTALGPVHRRTHGLVKLRESLGQPPGRGLVCEFPDKPKWMRWRTYERLVREAAEREDRHWSVPVPPSLSRVVARARGGRS